MGAKLLILYKTVRKFFTYIIRSVLNLFWLKGTKYKDKKYNIEQTENPNINIGKTIPKLDKPAFEKIKSSDPEISLCRRTVAAI